MSGVFGFYGKVPIDDEVLKSLLATGDELRGTPQTEWTRVGNHLTGRVHLGVFHQPPIPADTPRQPAIVSSGFCTGGTSGPPGWSNDQLATLQRLLSQEDYDALSGLNGCFQCAELHADGHALALVNDRFGLMPLFVYERPSVFVYAPDLTLLQKLVRAAVADPSFRFALDSVALVEWLEIGLVMGDRTLLHDVTLMPPGSVVLWDGERSRTICYWRPRFNEDDQPFNFTERSEALDAALRRSLRSRADADRRLCISLSGGLDSRLLLGAAVREGLNVSALTFGPEHSDDHETASVVAGLLGRPHHQFFDTPDAAVSCFDEGVCRTSGMSNVFDLWGLQHGSRIRETTVSLVNGIGGNELLGFLAFDLLRFKIPRSPEYLSQWLLRKLNPGWSEADLALIRHALGHDAPTVRERIGGFWSDCPAQSPIARVYQFYFEEKSHKSNALGVATDDLFVEPIGPFLDYDVADIGLQIPPRHRLLARFYRRFFCAQYPALARIPYSRTGLPVGASAGRILSGKLARRRQRGRSEPQSPWADWLRRDLAPAVHARLTDASGVLADILPGAIAQTRVNALMTGETSATMPIGQLLSLESFLRQFKPSL